MKTTGFAPVSPLEQLFTPRQIAEAWQLDETTIRRLFIDQPGVLRIGRKEARGGKRSYVTLRIPPAVAERVYRERSK